MSIPSVARLHVRLAVWTFLALPLVLGPGHVPAAGAAPGQEPGPACVTGVRQQDLDGDGLPNLTVLDCTVITPYDRVLVFDGARNMRPAGRWEEATDFVDDTWVFQVGERSGEGRAALVVAFSADGADTLARVYDGSVTGGTVSYAVEGGRIRVTAPQYPSMVIRARGGGWLGPGGALNYNLIWQYDGPAASREYVDRYPAALRLDGHPDKEGEARDEDGDGVPEYLWYALTAPIPDSERIPRTGIQVNSGRHRPAPLTGVLFWPLLNLPQDPQGRNYFDTPLFLGVDWKAGLIVSFNFRGYPVEEGYHVNSTSGLRRGTINSLSFENPMAYYDLADDRDGRPELFIRLTYTPPGDPYFVSGGPTRLPLEMVQFSWNQRNHGALLWDYKVDLAGRHELGKTVALGETLIEQVPHEELPRWTVERPWAFATFVAYETGEGYLSSEGIYDWPTLEEVMTYEGVYAGATLQGVQAYTGSSIKKLADTTQIQRDYVAGVSAELPESLYRDILAGFRGEYAELDGPVWLSFSPVDARLHLVGTKRGVYNAGSGRRVVYRDVDGDALVNSWELFTGTQPVAQLLQAPGVLLYGAADRVQLRRADLPRELFRVQPPADHDEWARLDARLTANRRSFRPDDLELMLRQFGGPGLEVSGASLSGYRSLEGGAYRFVLELRPGFAVAGTDFLELAGLPPGTYIVTSAGAAGPFRVDPATAPLVSVSLVGTTLRELEGGRLRLALLNEGLQDVQEATLEVWAAAGERPGRIATQSVTLLSREPTAAVVDWAPPRSGVWALTPVLRLPDGGG